MSTIREVPTGIMVTIWPEDAEESPDTALDSYMWCVSVVYRGHGMWAIVRGDHNSGTCLSRDDVWHIEPRPSERNDSWLKAHRYTKDEAMAKAREWAPKIRIQGITAAELVAQKTAARSAGVDETLSEIRDRLSNQ